MKVFWLNCQKINKLHYLQMITTIGSTDICWYPRLSYEYDHHWIWRTRWHEGIIK